MFDGQLRTMIDPTLNSIADRLVARKITANQITLFGFGLGCAAFVLIANTYFWSGLALLLLSRLCDGLDGAVAKKTKPTDFGGYLDIVLDFAFYGMIPVGFAIADPAQNAVPAAILVLSFYVNGASFLAFATICEKRGLTTEARGKKTFYFTTGLAEASETLLVFVLFALFHQWFAVIAYIFAAICFYTAFARIMQAKALFDEESDHPSDDKA